MREINPDLREFVLATMPGPQPAEFAALHKQHPRCRFTWHVSSPGGSAEELDELYREATILLTINVLPERRQAPKLKLVQLFSAGADHLAGNGLFTGSDVVFATASGVHGPQIAEHIFMTLLSITHHLPLLLSWQRSRSSWQQPSIWGSPTAALTPTHDLVSQRVGILGYGSIGRQVARVAQGLGMSIHAYTASARPSAASRRDMGYIVPRTGDPAGEFPDRWFSGSSVAALHEFLRSGLDVLVVTAPLTKRTQHLLGAAEFEILSAPRPKTGRGAFVINISRGGLIDHDALLAALKCGGLAGASLDVTEPEPLPLDNELWGLKNVLITPHVSGFEDSYMERVIDIFAVNLGRLKMGERLVNVVDRGREY